MSTTVYNGYMVPFSNSKKVEAINLKLRTIFTKLLNDHIINEIAKIASLTGNYYMNSKIPTDRVIEDPTCVEFFKIHIHELCENLAFEAYKKALRSNDNSIIGTATAIVRGFSEYNIESNLNFKNQGIYFKTIGKRTVYYFAVDSEIISKFDEINKKEKLLQDFSFFDNTDKPDNVNSAEWRVRHKVWKSVLKNSCTFSGVMNLIPIEMKFFINQEQFIDYIPDAHTRLRNIYKRTRVDEIVKQFKEASLNSDDIESFDLSFYTNALFDASEIVIKEIDDGLYLNSKKHLEMVDNQEVFINFLFSKNDK